MIVVSDTTAITALLQIGRVELLATLYGEVLIPEAVRNELLQAHHNTPEFLRVEKVLDIAEVQRLRSELDVGEAEAIVLSKEKAADLLLIDEAEGRRVALREGLSIIGLLGVLVHAKRTGLIISVRTLAAELEQTAGFRVSDEVKEIVFRNAGE
ncbi:MAG: DUF3368 domain-containing protein [Verrucomicrobia bacterium]|nr:DUF3368 domain-containing protein [Verrucomicrobiota bacterium]